MTWERGVFLAGAGILIYTTLFALIELVDVITLIMALP